MIRTLVAVAAVSGLMMTSAFAQMSDKNATTETQLTQRLMTRVMGSHVLATDGTKVGTVNDVLFDKSGRVEALIVGIGGVMGIGQKDVAIPIASFGPAPAERGTFGADQLRISMSRDQVRQLAEFKPSPDLTETIGAGGGLGPNPAWTAPGSRID